jgi:hypothetical protein
MLVMSVIQSSELVSSDYLFDEAVFGQLLATSEMVICTNVHPYVPGRTV